MIKGPSVFYNFELSHTLKDVHFYTLKLLHFSLLLNPLSMGDIRARF